MQAKAAFLGSRPAAAFIVLMIGFLAAALPAAAQNGVYTPKSGSPERKAIMNALRVPVEKDLKMPVIFVVSHPEIFFRVKQDWAFVGAEFRHPNGRPMGKEYYKDDPDGSDISDMVLALLHRTHGQWHVVDHDTGAIDAAWAGWSRYHAPPSLFPKS